MLAGMAATGQVPVPPGGRPNPFSPERQELAGRLFVTLADLPPLMMFAAALSERNGETIKALPVRHRILQGSFWDYHDWVFGHQESITPDNLKEIVTIWAKDRKDIDSLQLGQCMDTKA